MRASRMNLDMGFMAAPMAGGDNNTNADQHTSRDDDRSHAPPITSVREGPGAGRRPPASGMQPPQGGASGYGHGRERERVGRAEGDDPRGPRRNEYQQPEDPRPYHQRDHDRMGGGTPYQSSRRDDDGRGGRQYQTHRGGAGRGDPPPPSTPYADRERYNGRGSYTGERRKRDDMGPDDEAPDTERRVKPRPSCRPQPRYSDMVTKRIVDSMKNSFKTPVEVCPSRSSDLPSTTNGL
jgi:hypothetical protein